MTEVTICASCPEKHQERVAQLCLQHGVQKAFGKTGDMVDSLSGKDWIPKWEAKVVMATVTKAQTLGLNNAQIICIAGGKHCDAEMARQPALVRAIKTEMANPNFRVRVEWLEIETFLERYPSKPSGSGNPSSGNSTAAKGGKGNNGNKDSQDSKGSGKKGNKDNNNTQDNKGSGKKGNKDNKNNKDEGTAADKGKGKNSNTETPSQKGQGRPNGQEKPATRRIKDLMHRNARKLARLSASTGFKGTARMVPLVSAFIPLEKRDPSSRAPSTLAAVARTERPASSHTLPGHSHDMCGFPLIHCNAGPYTSLRRSKCVPQNLWYP